MRLATRQSDDVYGPLGSVMKNSATFGDALDYVSTHIYAHSLAARVWQKRLRSGNAVFVGHDVLLDRMPPRSQTMEQLLHGGRSEERHVGKACVSACRSGGSPNNKKQKKHKHDI